MDEVAVKKIRAERPTAAQLRTFHYEVNCLRLLCHRNIVQVCWEWAADGRLR